MPNDPFAAGLVVDERYRVLAPLRQGGMGTLYVARDLSDGGNVALKVVHAELARDAGARRRFEREVHVLRAVRHPALVRLLGAGEHAGHPYLVMELVEGRTLDVCVREGGAMRCADLVPVVEALCGALTALHACDVVHGDVKPANLFVRDSSVSVGAHGSAAILVDLGLAKVRDLERFTRTGELAGTPAFLAPELITGTADLDSRIDLYAAGVLLYFALAASLPFRSGHPGQLLMRIVRGECEPLAGCRTDLPQAVIAVVERAMAPSPASRYASAAELARAFRAAAEPT